MSRTLSNLTQEVREMLRAEGSDGGGFSDFIVCKALNAGLADIATIYPVRDTLIFHTTDAQNEYDLNDVLLAPQGVTDIVRVIYDGKLLRGITIDDYLSVPAPTEGAVNHWVLWGKQLMFVGHVENKEVKALITRPAKELTSPDSVPEVPPVADKAIVQFALAVCYQEARNDEAYGVALTNYYRMKSALNLHGSPRGQRDIQTRVRDSYWGARKSRGWTRASDKNPHPG